MAVDEYLVAPKAPPPLNIPPSNAKVSVKIIDSTSLITCLIDPFYGPPIPGHTHEYAPAFSFLIEHDSGRKLLYDLGTRKDWQNLAPAIVAIIKEQGWGVEVEKDVAEILREQGVDLTSIEGIIWSHWHYDHTGDPATFPPSTKLIVGPGFKDSFVPAYPKNPQSLLLETDWEGRELHEVTFSGLRIGKFRALDYFGDGSFYILDTPGHAIGHLCGLARVTAGGDDSFVFMGGDACHHGGEYRPTEYLPLPTTISPSPIASKRVCPGALFADIFHHKRPDQPPYALTKNFPQDFDVATQTIRDLEEFDADPNVFVIIAHDAPMLDKEAEIDFYPHGTLNNWKKSKLNEKTRWLFLKHFAHAAEHGLVQPAEMGAGLVLRP